MEQPCLLRQSLSLHLERSMLLQPSSRPDRWATERTRVESKGLDTLSSDAAPESKMLAAARESFVPQLVPSSAHGWLGEVGIARKGARRALWQCGGPRRTLSVRAASLWPPRALPGERV